MSAAFGRGACGPGGSRLVPINAAGVRFREAVGDGEGGRRRCQSPNPEKKKRQPKRVLALPDLEQAKTAVLNSLTSASRQRTDDHAIREFVSWYARNYGSRSTGPSCSGTGFTLNNGAMHLRRSAFGSPPSGASRTRRPTSACNLNDFVGIEGLEVVPVPLPRSPSLETTKRKRTGRARLVSGRTGTSRLTRSRRSPETAQTEHTRRCQLQSQSRCDPSRDSRGPSGQMRQPGIRPHQGRSRTPRYPRPRTHGTRGFEFLWRGLADAPSLFVPCATRPPDDLIPQGRTRCLPTRATFVLQQGHKRQGEVRYAGRRCHVRSGGCHAGYLRSRCRRLRQAQSPSANQHDSIVCQYGSPFLYSCAYMSQRSALSDSESRGCPPAPVGRQTSTRPALDRDEQLLVLSPELHRRSARRGRSRVLEYPRGE
jgi:hypothetical protein